MKKRGWKDFNIRIYTKIRRGLEDEVYEKRILHPSTIFQNTRIFKIIKIFVSYHRDRGRSIRKKWDWKVQKFLYNRVFSRVENGKIFVSQNIQWSRGRSI